VSPLRGVLGAVFAAWAVLWGVAFVASRHPLDFGLSLACAGMAWWWLEDAWW
jgi:hypothetical protein